MFVRYKIRKLVREIWKLEKSNKTDASSKLIQAKKALESIRDPKAVKWLIAALNEDSNHIREAVTKALGEIGDPQSVEPIINTSLASLVNEAARALGKIKDPRAVDPLMKKLVPYGNRQCIVALGDIGDPRAIVSLMNFLSDYHSDMRRAAAEALFKLGAVEWKEIVKGDPEDFMRIAQSGHSRKTALLINAISRRWYDEPTKINAAKALGEANDAQAKEALILALADDSGILRQEIAETLSRLGEPQWKDMIRGDAKDYIRIGESKHPLSVQILSEVVMNRSNDVGEAAAKGLQATGTPQAVEALIGALKNRNPYVCKAVIKALGDTKDPQGVQPLVKVLHENPDMRIAAVNALGAIGDEQAVEALSSFLERRGRQNDVCRIVVEALVSIGGPKTAPPLFNMLERGYADWSCRKRAASVLISLAKKYPEAEVLVSAGVGLINAPHKDGMRSEHSDHGKSYSSDCTTTYAADHRDGYKNVHRDFGIGLDVGDF